MSACCNKEYGLLLAGVRGRQPVGRCCRPPQQLQHVLQAPFVADVQLARLQFCQNLLWWQTDATQQLKEGILLFRWVQFQPQENCLLAKYTPYQTG